jgi:hypothetical protein
MEEAANDTLASEVKIEHAKRALALMSEKPLPQPCKDYFEAIVNNQLPKYYLEQLLEKRSYSDDLPEPAISPDHPNYKFERLAARDNHPAYPKLKCRGNAICEISMTLRASVDDKVVTGEEALKAIDDFMSHDWNYCKGGKGENWTTPEEIQLINKTLDTVISCIKDDYKL